MTQFNYRTMEQTINRYCHSVLMCLVFPSLLQVFIHGTKTLQWTYGSCYFHEQSPVSFQELSDEETLYVLHNLSTVKESVEVQGEVKKECIKDICQYKFSGLYTFYPTRYEPCIISDSFVNNNSNSNNEVQNV